MWSNYVGFTFWHDCEKLAAQTWPENFLNNFYDNWDSEMRLGSRLYDQFGRDISLFMQYYYYKKHTFLEEKCQKMVKNFFLGHEMKFTDKYSCLVVLSLI